MFFYRLALRRVMTLRNQTLTSLTLVILMMLSSILPGCIESADEVEEEVNPNAAPKEAMGMWWPTVDGIIESPTISPHTEWSDSDEIEIDFLDESGSKHAAILRYKSVEEGLALAVEIDKLDETPKEIVLTLPDRELSIGLPLTPPPPSPSIELDLLDLLWKNEIAAVHNLDTGKYVMESTAKQLFDDTTEVSYTISVIFSESVWKFEKTTDFGWVLPYLFPRSDISVTGIEVTQAIQTADMQMRLVEGKTSLARVYVDSGDLATANVEVTLKYCILIFCVDELTKTHVAVQSPDRTDFSHSANFVLPDHWVTHEGIEGPIPIGLIASIKPSYPTGVIDYLDPDAGNNVDFGVFWFNHTRDFSVWAVPIGQDTNGDGVQEFLPAATINNLMQASETLLPVSSLNQVNIPTASAPICTIPIQASACNDIIETWMITTLLSSCGFWETLGMVTSNTGLSCLGMPWPDQIHGMTPITGTGVGFSDWGGIATASWGSGDGKVIPSLISNSGTCGPNQPTGLPSWTCVAHEMTHNLGPYCMDNNGDGDCTDITDEAWGAHLPQCGAGGSDAVWSTNFQPYNIKDIGWNPLTTNPDTNPLALVPSGYPDYMSYCRAQLATGGVNFPVASITTNSPANGGGQMVQWTSTLRWENMYDKFLNWEEGDSPDNPFNGRQTQNYSTRVITGIVTKNTSGDGLEHSWSINNPIPSVFQREYTAQSHHHHGHGDDDHDDHERTFHCSSTVGGTPDTEIPFSQVNDGTEDCGDGSDEPQDFDGDGSVDNWFDCMDGSKVSMEFVNDGTEDCPDGEDEHDSDHDDHQNSRSMYTIVTKDSSGNDIEKISFNPTFVDPYGGAIDHHFSYLVEDNNNLIHSIELLRNGTMVDILYSSGQPTIRMQPLGTTEYTRETPANLSWTQASPTSNRETLYQLEYSWDNGKWLPIGGMTNSTSKVLDFGTLPAGDDAKFRVRATNGFDTYYSESTSFNLPNQAPKLTLETSGALGLNTVGDDAQLANVDLQNIQVTQGESFSIMPYISDDDWTSINENGCTAVLKRGKETVWSDGNTINTAGVREMNRITSHPSESLEHGPGMHDSVHCLHNNGAFLPYSFPNKDLLPGEMIPGDYVFEMTYVDIGGASVTKTVSFTISGGISDGEILDEYRSKLEMMSNISKMNSDLNRGELQYYLELSRNARGDDDALTDAEITELQKLYEISDSRAEEIAAMD